MENAYFVVELVDGSTLDFNKQCNSVKYDTSNYVLCKHTEDDSCTYTTLAIIPHKSIFSILRVVE